MTVILLATDGSFPALVATEKAVAMAKERDATLVVLKVIESIPLVDTERIAENVAHMRPLGDDGTVYATKLAEEANVPVKVIVREGPVVGMILKVVEEEHVDAIVMGTSSLKGINRLYLGSVAKTVVNQASVSVTVVKPTPQEIEQIKEKLKTMVAAPVKMASLKSIISTRQFKVGVYLFAAYAIGYAVFVLAGSYARNLFRDALFGLNVGIVAGIVIIVVTVVMAVAFNWYAGRAERRA
jgi:nucleotide-binding universal stress UspA family protein